MGKPDEQFVICSSDSPRIDCARLRCALRFLLVSLLLGTVISACDQPSQTVSLTIEDFKFTPDVVRVNASAPLSITLYNAGREIHEFDSPVLTYRVNALPARVGPGISLAAGDSLRLVLAPPPGTYLYICRRKGHANMTGMIIVEQN